MVRAEHRGYFMLSVLLCRAPSWLCCSMSASCCSMSAPSLFRAAPSCSTALCTGSAVPCCSVSVACCSTSSPYCSMLLHALLLLPSHTSVGHAVAQRRGTVLRGGAQERITAEEALGPSLARWKFMSRARRGRAFSGEGTARPKALRQEHGQLTWRRQAAPAHHGSALLTQLPQMSIFSGLQVSR